MRRFAVISVAVAAALIATPALAAKVIGKIIVTKEFREALAEAAPAPADERLEGYWNEPNGIIPVEPPRVDPSRDLAVVIIKEGAPAPGPNQLETVQIRTAGLERSVVVTRPKSTIRLRSSDPFDHELYSPELESFRPERQANGAFRPIEFPAEGVYHIRCKLMPHFNAYVLVTNATLVMSVDEKGNFTIDEAEPGNYTVKVFHGGEWVEEQKFEVKDDKKVKEVRVEVKLGGGKPGAADAPKQDDGKADGKPGEAAAEPAKKAE
jgi:hypothetical protein